MGLCPKLTDTPLLDVSDSGLNEIIQLSKSSETFKSKRTEDLVKSLLRSRAARDQQMKKEPSVSWLKSSLELKKRD